MDYKALKLRLATLIIGALLNIPAIYGDSTDPGRHRRWVFGGPPQFHPDTPANVTSQLGGTASLPCRIKNLGNKSVSWIRSRDSHILTVDRYTFIADERFVAYHDRATRSWTLTIRYVQERDVGLYECQISTEPKLSHFVQMEVVEPVVEITGKPDIYVKSGSRVGINCTIQNSLEMPQYIFWYHDNDRIVDDTDNRHMKVMRIDSKTTTGSFVIKVASIADSGKYTCEPAGLGKSFVNLHVLADEEPAAMQHGINAGPASKPIGVILSTVALAWCAIFVSEQIYDSALLTNLKHMFVYHMR